MTAFAFLGFLLASTAPAAGPTIKVCAPAPTRAAAPQQAQTAAAVPPQTGPKLRPPRPEEMPNVPWVNVELIDCPANSK